MEEVVNEVEETTNNEPNIEEEVSEEIEDTNEEELEQEEVQDEEETSEEPLEDEEEVPEYTKSQVKKMMEKRLGRMSNSYQKKEERLLSVLKAGGFEGNNLDELTDELISNYKEEGIEIPEYHSNNNGLSDREQEALAKLDAEEIIEMGDLAMENRFAELYEKPNRTLREEKEMEAIGREASLKNARKELTKLGLDAEKMLNDEKFLEFASEMSSDVSIGKIVKYYQKINGDLPQKPKSTGSIKSKGGNAVVKDFYTPEEAQQFTRKELDENPALYEAICDSMTKW